MTYLELFPFCFSYTRACRSDRSETFLLLREITRRPSSRIDPDRIEEKRKWLRESVKSILQKKEKGRGGIFICSKKGANFRGGTNSRATNSLRESFNRVWFHRERSRKRARERERESTGSSSRFYIRPFLLSFSFHPVHISDVKRRFATADRTPRCNQ